MTFPESPRVLYASNPLTEVICQVKFPPILRVDNELPAAFQEKVRDKYPLMREQLTAQFRVPQAVVQRFQGTLASLVPGRSYSFVSEDTSWTLAIGRDFVALSTTRYSRWEDFRKRLQSALEAFVDVYRPSFAVRIGLRYRDLIRKSSDELKGYAWSDLLRSEALGELGSSDVADLVQHTQREVVISLRESAGQVRVLHGLIRVVGDSDFSYSIDSDFFTEKRTGFNDIYKTLDVFNAEAGRLFRWYITPLLEQRLGATPIT